MVRANGRVRGEKRVRRFPHFSDLADGERDKPRRLAPAYSIRIGKRKNGTLHIGLSYRYFSALPVRARRGKPERNARASARLAEPSRAGGREQGNALPSLRPIVP